MMTNKRTRNHHLRNGSRRIEKSDGDGGTIVRSKVPCNGGHMKLTRQQANASSASSYRLQTAHFEPSLCAAAGHSNS